MTCREFMKLSLAERLRILEQQAEAMADYYETETEWRDFQGDDFIDYESDVMAAIAAIVEDI
jgi:hypothetical protein